MANESKHKAAFTFIVMGIRSKNSEPRKWQKNAVSTSLIFVVIGMPSKDCKPRRWQKKVNTMQCLPSWSCECPSRIVGPGNGRKKPISTSLTVVVIGMPSKDCKPRRWQKKANSAAHTFVVMECPSMIVGPRNGRRSQLVHRLLSWS